MVPLVFSWLRKKLQPKREIVLEILDEHGPLRAVDIAHRSLGRLRQGGIYSHLLNLEKDGLITRCDRIGIGAIYQISRNGRLALAQIRAS